MIKSGSNSGRSEESLASLSVSRGIPITGLPALLVPLLMFLPLAVNAVTTQEMSDRYQNLVTGALEANDFATAELFLPKARQLAPESPELEFAALQIDAVNGRIEDAVAKARALTQADRKPFPPALLWVSEHLLESFDAGIMNEAEKPAVLAEVGHHLKRAEQTADTAIQSQLLYLTGKMHLAAGEFALARRHLEQSLPQTQSAYRPLVEACEHLGDTDAARGYLKVLRKLLEKNVRDGRATEDVRQLADVCYRLGDFLHAEQLLQSAIRKCDTLADAEKSLRLRQQLSEVYLNESQTLFDDKDISELSTLKALLMLGRAIETYPANQKAITQFLETAALPQADEYANLLKRRAANHFFTNLFTACREETLEAAARELHAAKPKMDNFVVAVNNIAWSAMETKPPQLAVSRRLCNGLLHITGERSPARTLIGLTVGRLYLCEGRIDEAIHELTLFSEQNPQNEAASGLLMEAELRKTSEGLPSSQKAE